MKNYLIIGGGVIGSSIAREISQRGLGNVIVLEKEVQLAQHASGRNSGVIHSGINHKPDTLKARMCLEGSLMLRDYCREHDIPMHECGTIVVARNSEEENRLENLLQMGLEVGVPCLRIIGRDELKEKETAIEGTKALFSPTGAIVNSTALVASIANEAKSLGAHYHMGCKVESIEKDMVTTNYGRFKSDQIINCAGLYCDKIAHMMHMGLDFMVVPFKGSYMKINLPINSMVYHVPDLRYPFLGVHLTKSIDGKVIAGPTAELSWRGREAYDRKTDISEFLEMLKSINFLRLVSNSEFLKIAAQNFRITISKKTFINEVNSFLKGRKISECDIHPYKCGIRAQVVDKKGRMVNDFLIERNYYSIHILNTVSPGLTSSLAFAKYVVDNYIEK